MQRVSLHVRHYPESNIAMFPNQPPVTTDPALLAAARTYFPDATGVESRSGFPRQVFVVSGEREWAVQRWPAASTITSLEWIAEAMAMARHAGVTTVLEHATAPGRGAQRALLLDGQLYDAVSWPHGKPLNRYGTFVLGTGDVMDLPLPDSMAAPDVVLAAIQELAKFHVATAALANRADAPVLTLDAMLKAAEHQYAELRRIVGRHAGQHPEIRRWLRCGNRILPAAAERIGETGTLQTARTCAIHGAVWPGRLLVDDRAGEPVLTGITGWMRAAASVPVIDLARLAARCARWSAATAETVVGAYADIAPLPPEQRRLLPVIAALDLTSITGTMLQAAFDDDRLIGDPVQALIRSGIQTSLRSMETLANVLAPEDIPARARTFHARPHRRDVPRAPRHGENTGPRSPRRRDPRV
jgi:hypothetical protein